MQREWEVGAISQRVAELNARNMILMAKRLSAKAELFKIDRELEEVQSLWHEIQPIVDLANEGVEGTA